MKTMRFILTIFLLTNIMVGCEEDPIFEPVVKGDAYPVPTSIKAGQPVTIKYSSSKDVTVVTINGAAVPISAGSVTYTPTTTTDYIVKFIGPNNITDQKSFTVNVEPIVVVDPNKARTDSLCSKGLYLTEEKVLVDGVWTYTNLQEVQKTSPLYFYTNGKYEKFSPNGTLVANGNWSWDGPNTINMDGGIYKYSLTDTQFKRFKRNDTGIEIYTFK